VAFEEAQQGDDYGNDHHQLGVMTGSMGVKHIVSAAHHQRVVCHGREMNCASSVFWGDEISVQIELFRVICRKCLVVYAMGIEWVHSQTRVASKRSWYSSSLGVCPASEI
jgi:hypothetical protein